MFAANWEWSNWLLAFERRRFVHYKCGAAGATYSSPSGRLRVTQLIYLRGD